MTLATVTTLLVVATLLPRWSHPHWLVRGLDFPRLQLATVAVALLAAEILWLDRGEALTWLLVAATSLCLAWQAWWIVPFSPFWPQEVKAARDARSDRRIRILTANVLTSNRNADALIELVRNRKPDVLVTLESDQWWQDQLDVLESEMPYALKCPLDNLYGMHLYSRLPLEDAEIAYLIEDDKPSMHAGVSLRSGDAIRMHFLHPAPPGPTENAESAERDAELVVVARSVAKSDQPVVVTGDLNDVAWSSTTRLFRKISGLLDPRIGRGIFNTFHVGYPFLRWPLDHIFHSSHFTLATIERLPSIGSDHFPLFTELAFEPARTVENEGLSADATDRTRAEAIVRAPGITAARVPRPGE